MIKYIFCINPGRTGSEYISRLLASVQDVASFHEPKPILHGALMQEYLTGNSGPLRDRVPDKLSFIHDQLARNNNKYYFEANHNFIKGFGWLLPDFVPQEEIGVIILKRDQKSVVDSLYKVHAHPFTTTGENWIIVPQFYKDNLIPFPDNYGKLSFNFYRIQYRIMNKLRKIFPIAMPAYISDYSKTLVRWYVEETYALGEEFRKKFDRITAVEVSLDDLNSLEGFRTLLMKFGIPPVFKEDMSNVIGKKVNVR